MEFTALEPMSEHCSFKVGGPAGLFARAGDIKRLKGLICFAYMEKMPLYILGGGTNVLFPDGLYPGLVIKIEGGDFAQLTGQSSMSQKEQAKAPPGHELVTCGAAVRLGKLVDFAAKRGLTGVEDLVGIPGTVGGAVIMNAGAGTQAVGQWLQEISVLNRSTTEVKVLQKKEMKFKYRGFKCAVPALVVLDATFALQKGDPSAIKKRMDKRMKERRVSLPTEPSAGSFFRNPPGDHAGKLIDESGLKGKQKGGAMVSTKHANVIINTGGATTKDILDLSHEITLLVQEKSGVRLKREVRVVNI
ncbi:MAG: UDP-N-acetylmuramate dehydrogenase [Deltaproteobacteria bacterium]|jgi:UDP-N-acetylmuramate dehydrogenase|nr:UDP-N-acetylmuramate dehydrogenase [Deltaproteobacteria bacterium]